MPYPRLTRAMVFFTSVFRSTVELPEYVASNEPFTDRPLGPEQGNGPIFVSARFRSGSTLVWQIFNMLPDFTAYYEPFNERRWFDPDARGNLVDSTHRGVSDYAANYQNLKGLDQYFDTLWASKKLAMGQGATDANMVAFLEQLIRTAPKRPLLQFNRVDFRLAFLKEVFPRACIVHLRRNPRDCWRSTLREHDNDPNWNLLTFQPFCNFYLLPWYRDLSIVFPEMLRPAAQTHPYEIYYLIHRLSELFARRDANFFISYEQLNTSFVKEAGLLLEKVRASSMLSKEVEALYAPRQSQYDHSADMDLYSGIEAKVEQALKAWLASK